MGFSILPFVVIIMGLRVAFAFLINQAFFLFSPSLCITNVMSFLVTNRMMNPISNLLVEMEYLSS